jgi:uncharacterized protein YjbJ (UPF0337 family)
MNSTAEINGNWTEIKGKLKQKFAILTDDDLLFAKGKQEELLGRLEIRLSKTRQEIQKILSEL